VSFLVVAQGSPLVVLVTVGVSRLLGTHPGAAAVAATATSAALIAARVPLLIALEGSYARRGLAFWLSPLADPLAALRILLSTLRRPTRWRTREYRVAAGAGVRP
jgi:dolichol-phosphate mannosyltransferase